jgi:Tfp pilus assembly protein PilX
MNSGQSGAALVVGLIMLGLITMVITTAFNMSTTNLRAVGNMQSRDESLAAANAAIERVIASDFQNGIAAPAPQEIDINYNGSTDFTATFAIPSCLSAVADNTDAYSALWEINATVIDNKSGASINVKQGVRVLISATSPADTTARARCGIATSEPDDAASEPNPIARSQPKIRAYWYIQE